MSGVVSSRKLLLISAGLFLGTLLLFSRAWRNDFVNYDDPDYVTSNAHVKAGLTAAGARWAFSTGDVSYWHPLTWLSHMLDWQMFGDQPRGHHAVSTLWHALNAVLAFAVFRRLTGSLWTSAIAAALFAWHPLRAESVAWVAERKDVLSGFFWLAAIWAYARYAQCRSARRPAWGWYAAALTLFAGGLMSKPMVVTLPVVLLVLDAWPLRRLTKRDWPRVVAEKIPFGVLSAVVSAITVHAQQQVGTLSEVLPPGARLANAAVAVMRYIGKFFVPVDLAVLYPHPGVWPAGKVFFAVIFVLTASAVAGWQWKRRPWFLAGWLWFLIALLPVSGVVQVGIQSMADRYTYLPLLGVELALLWTLRDACVSASARRTCAAIAAAGLAVCAGSTWHQLGFWQNSLTLFEHTIAVAPAGNYLAYNNRGYALAEAGRNDEAIADYRRSLAINAAYPDANNNLGHALVEEGRAADAIPLFRTALAAKPGQLEIHTNLANALSDVGALDEAIQHYEFVLARDPRHVNALNGYGVALAMKGRVPEAVARFEAALRLDPANAAAHGNLGNVAAMQGRRDEAIAHYRRAIALKPDASTFYNLGNVCRELGRNAEAVENYQHAVDLAPTNSDAQAALGFMLAQTGRRDDGIRHLRLALQQRPDHAQASAWLQAVLAPPGAK